MDNIIPPETTQFKQCYACGFAFPATKQFFYSDSHKKDGFTPRCKNCFKALIKSRKPREELPEGQRRCSKCKKILPATQEYFYARPSRKSGFRSKCKVCEHLIEMQRNRPKASKEANHLRYLVEQERRLRYRYVYYHSHKEEYRQYRKTHALLSRIHAHNRRARIKSAKGSHTRQDVLRQFKRQHGRCYYCHIKIKGTYHVDHVIPITRGGSDDPSNLVIACPSCNQSKHNKLLHEWTRGGRLL